MWFGYTNESEPDEKIGFWKQEKKRQRQCFDAKATLAYLCHLRSTTDPAMFWSYSVDEVGRNSAVLHEMESLVIPCDHIVGVLKHLSIWELPKCLVLDRWTKKAKESMGRENDHVEMLQAAK
ncbi:hypothetical protein VNO78_03035 [Psophocarpus tetragonolobus]|uniref:Protein FAR1-RELATED SEQUENCE n=1 Tax=Psophocarpus tetragonolobus TaxID=3891 RepID=A0AAN9XV84_PSOTE